VNETHVSVLQIAARQAHQLPLLKGLDSEADQDPAWFPNSSTSAHHFAGNAEQPSWAPDGRRVAFVSLAQGLNVVTERADGSHRRTIAQNATSPAWSPNGNLIAFDRCPRCTTNDMTSSIYTVHADGSGLRRLYTDHPGTDIGFGQLDWQALR
jgi:Tol biopolymer transport system component